LQLKDKLDKEAEEENKIEINKQNKKAYSVGGKLPITSNNNELVNE